MKIKTLKLVGILFLVAQISVLFAGAFISYFHGRSTGDSIVLEWQTGQETNLKAFVIERKTPISTFSEIGTVYCKGSNSVYTYTDNNAYKSNEAAYIYRLKLVDKDGESTYSSEVTVTHGGVSSVKRTWGSIKALFR